MPHDMVAQHLNVDPAVLDGLSMQKTLVM